MLARLIRAPRSRPHTAIKNQAAADQDAYYQQRRFADEHVVKLGISTIIVAILQALSASITFFVIAFVAVRQLSSYVYPEQILINSFDCTDPMVITIDIWNIGTTPAKNTEIHGSLFADKIH